MTEPTLENIAKRLSAIEETLGGVAVEVTTLSSLESKLTNIEIALERIEDALQGDES